MWKSDAFASQLKSGINKVVEEWPIVFVPPERHFGWKVVDTAAGATVISREKMWPHFPFPDF